jgi:hypothetical protein
MSHGEVLCREEEERWIGPWHDTWAPWVRMNIKDEFLSNMLQHYTFILLKLILRRLLERIVDLLEMLLILFRKHLVSTKSRYRGHPQQYEIAASSYMSCHVMSLSFHYMNSTCIWLFILYILSSISYSLWASQQTISFLSEKNVKIRNSLLSFSSPLLDTRNMLRWTGKGTKYNNFRATTAIASDRGAEQDTVPKHICHAGAKSM